VVLAKSMERIHRANLINFCILPLTFANPDDYDSIEPGDRLVIADLRQVIKEKDELVIAKDDGSAEFVGKLDLSPRDREILLADGLLSYMRMTGQ
jgi:aconitate hydratase